MTALPLLCMSIVFLIGALFFIILWEPATLKRSPSHLKFLQVLTIVLMVIGLGLSVYHDTNSEYGCKTPPTSTTGEP